MKERPILFSSAMVRAILAGKKTQTRRVMKPQPKNDAVAVKHFRGREWHALKPSPEIPGLTLQLGAHPCPYGEPGDRLRVKEHAWMWCEKVPNGTTTTGRPKFKYVQMRDAAVYYCADSPEKPATAVVSPYRGYEWGWRKKLGRFLPSWASRITLEITAVRVERLQDISEADAQAEGCQRPELSPRHMEIAGTRVPVHPMTGEYRAAYRTLWESINGPKSWDANPWVWCISFKRVQ